MSVINDKEYIEIINPIIKNEYFKGTYDISHHGISRMEHLIKVSYQAYKIAKKVGIDYISTARGGLLHDFFLDGNERNLKAKFLDTFTHPQKALTISQRHFELNDIEKNIIISHMFPLGPAVPKYKESILVDLVDKAIGFEEMIKAIKYQTVYKFNYGFVLLMVLIAQK